MLADIPHPGGRFFFCSAAEIQRELRLRADLTAELKELVGAERVVFGNPPG